MCIMTTFQSTNLVRYTATKLSSNVWDTSSLSSTIMRAIITHGPWVTTLTTRSPFLRRYHSGNSFPGSLICWSSVLIYERAPSLVSQLFLGLLLFPLQQLAQRTPRNNHDVTEFLLLPDSSPFRTQFIATTHQQKPR